MVVTKQGTTQLTELTPGLYRITEPSTGKTWTLWVMEATPQPWGFIVEGEVNSSAHISRTGAFIQLIGWSAMIRSCIEERVKLYNTLRDTRDGSYKMLWSMDEGNHIKLFAQNPIIVSVDEY